MEDILVKKYKAAISDTDILINLAKVDKLNILELVFSRIVIPYYVYNKELRDRAKSLFCKIEEEINRQDSIFEVIDRNKDFATNKLAKRTIEEYKKYVGPGESECAGYAEAFRIPIIISDNSTEFQWMDDRYIMLTNIDILVICTKFKLLSDIEADKIYSDINNLLTHPSSITFDTRYSRSLKSISDKGWNEPLGLE